MHLSLRASSAGKAKAARRTMCYVKNVANLKKSHQAVAESDAPACPRCGAPMVLRTARATDKKFFGCSNYPQCRGMRPVEA